MSGSNSVQQKKSRRNMVLLLLVFALPVVIAKLALELGWLQYGVTNKGELLNEKLTLTTLGFNKENFQEKNWLILYVLPAQCQQNCQQALEKIHNTYVALGKEMPRVTPVILAEQQLSTAQLARIEKSQWQVIKQPKQAKQQLAIGSVYIVDPLGNFILNHKQPNEIENIDVFGKAILADMKKLLKYSRVG